jgi:hypothetical protein
MFARHPFRPPKRQKRGNRHTFRAFHAVHARVAMHTAAKPADNSAEADCRPFALSGSAAPSA